MTQVGSSSVNADLVAIKAEAAAWIARLHSPDRSPADERSFRCWLQASPDHRKVFEQTTELWDASARLKSDTLTQIVNTQRSPWRLDMRREAIALTAACFLAAVGLVFLFRDPGVATGIGELRTVTLEDGSRITLNTTTRIRTEYTEEKRGVELVEGEAIFEVARKRDWPFIVSAGGKDIVALGTAFVIRRDARSVAVTLLEGKVEVAETCHARPLTPVAAKCARSVAGIEHELPVNAGARRERIVLAAGQRVTFAPESPPEIDEPSLEAVTAWKSGLVAFDNTPLLDAVSEMNRYSTLPIVVADPSGADIRVSGVFRAGDSREFARAAARAYGLHVHEEARAVRLSGSPVGEKDPQQIP